MSRIITGRAVTTDDAIKAGMIPGKPKMKTYQCHTCGKTCESDSPPANVDHGCREARWRHVLKK